MAQAVELRADNVATPAFASRPFTAAAVSSSLLSLRGCAGTPRSPTILASVFTTSAAASDRPTTSAWHSHVDSSTTGSTFSGRPSAIRSNTKS